MRRWIILGMLVVCSGIWAQEGSLPPEVRARMEAWRKWREEHKYTFQLLGLVGGLMQLEQEGKPLSAKQAKQVLAILQPLTKKQKLTQEEARKAQFALQKVLTAAQLNTISRMRAEARRRRGEGSGRPRNGFMGGGAPGGGAGGNHQSPGGRERQSGARFMQMDPAKLKNFNPFYFSGKPETPMMERYRSRMKKFMTELGKKAKA